MAECGVTLKCTIGQYFTTMTRQMYTISDSNGKVFIADLEPAISTISSLVNIHGQQKAIWKSKPVDISQWRQ